jgi:prepilin-type N-terminal cleavage/methylation domain-containing protein/prepilin-type processing-associated H-X9-DG protein
MRRQGFTLLEVLVVIAILSLVLGLVLAAIQRARSASSNAACKNHLRQLILAGHSYHNQFSHFPPGVSGEEESYPYMSWHTRLLPYLEYESLWVDAQKAFQTQPDFLVIPPHTAQLHAIKILGCPADSRLLANAETVGVRRHGLTSYLGIAGTSSFQRNGTFFINSTVSFHDIRDGSSNTIVIGERPPSTDLVFGWWYAGWGQDKDGDADMLLGVRAVNRTAKRKDCPSGPYHFAEGRFDNPCGMFHFWSPHTGGGANFAFADGSVKFLRYSADEIMPALATRAGGEVVTLSE